MDLDFQDKFKKVLEAIDKAGIEYASAKSNSYYSQEMKGSILASIMLASGEKTVSKSELIAKDSPEYRQHLKETAESIKNELLAKSKYEKLKCQFEAYRSLSSLEKSSRNLEVH